MNIQSVVFILVAGAASAVAGRRFLVLYKIMKAHQGKSPKIADIPARIATTLLNVLGQKAVLQKPGIGIAHTMIFWGFLIITVGTIEQFLSTLIPGFGWKDLVGDTAYGGFLFVHDLFTVLVLVGVAYAAYRRYVKKPPGLGKSHDADLVLTFTAGLMVSIFLMHGFELLGGHQTDFAGNMPFSNGVSQFLGLIFSPLGLSTETYGVLGTVFKWIHMLLVLSFGIYIPGSKHLHVVAAGPNTFLKKLNREKGMKPINFEDESVTQYGVAKVSDLSWKDALDYYSCTECGRCQDLCPAWNTEKPLSPKKLIIDLKENLYQNKVPMLAHKYDEVSPVINAKVTEDVIWACTSCRA